MYILFHYYYDFKYENFQRASLEGLNGPFKIKQEGQEGPISLTWEACAFDITKLTC